MLSLLELIIVSCRFVTANIQYIVIFNMISQNHIKSVPKENVMVT